VLLSTTKSKTEKSPKLDLTDSVQYVKGIGPVRAEALGQIGVETVEDLLYYVPRRYLDRSTILPTAKGVRAGENQEASIPRDPEGQERIHSLGVVL
jgi:RecG-like helicase